MGKRISVAAAKAKGRKLQQEIAASISELIDIPWGKDLLISSRPMGQSGVDIALIGEALIKFPWSVEAKYCEKLNVPGWIKQASTNTLPDTNWLLVFRKNRFKSAVVFEEEVFQELFDISDFEHVIYEQKTWKLEKWISDHRDSSKKWLIRLHKPDYTPLVCLDMTIFFEGLTNR